MSKKNYEDLPLSLAFFDGVPVLFFSMAMILLAMHVHNMCFIVGAVMISLAGLGKVIWKIIIAATKKDYDLLNKQLRVVMPIGFILLIAGIVTELNEKQIKLVQQRICSFPAIVFITITIVGMVLMSVFAFTLDSTKKRSHWIEQITNAIVQGCLLLGIFSCL